MFKQCTTVETYSSPFSKRRFNTDLRPALRTPLTSIKQRFYSEKNIKELTERAVALADKKGVVSSRIANLDVRKAVDRAYDEYRGSLATEIKKNHDQNVALNVGGGATLQSLVTNKDRELQILNTRAIKHVKMIIYERVLAEKRARILKVGVHAQAGLLSRPHRPAPREAFVGKLSQRGIPAGGIKETGLQALGNDS